MSELRMVNLDNHSVYSPQKSIVSINDLVDAAKARQESALALTDDNGIYGVTTFFDACKAANIKPIIGAQLNFCDDVKVKDRATSSIILLAKNKEGYGNLCRLISAAYEPKQAFYYVPRIDWNMLEEFHKGLVCTLGPKWNVVATHVFDGHKEFAEELFRRLNGIFMEDFHIEINPIANDEEYKAWARLAVTWAPLNYFVTNHTRFLKPEDYEYYDMLLCMGARPVKNYDDQFRKKADPNLYLKTQEQILETDFGLTKEEILQGFKNGNDVADSIDLDFEKKFFFPDPQIEEKDHDRYLDKIVSEGWNRCRPNLVFSSIENYRSRVKFELEVIKRLGYVDYFIVVADLVGWAKTNGIAVGPGRGSVAGCLVSYLLGITTVDPLRYNLIFERFLDPTGQRVSPPDIDIDFQHDRREEVIQYLIDKYGEEKVAAVGNIMTLKLRSAMKDVAKALDVPFERINAYTKYVSDIRHKKVEDLRKDRKWKHEIASNQELSRILHFTKHVMGTMRQMSTHAAGVLVAPDELLNHTPNIPIKDTDEDGNEIYTPTTQLDKDESESMGLLKIDVLALKTLTAMVHTIRLANKRWNYDIKIEQLNNIDFNDPKIYEFINKGLTGGLFQIEGQGITQLVMKLRPCSIEDICDLVALYRPAVIDSDLDGTPLTDIYLFNREKPEKHFVVVHETLRPVLNKTYGILLYQEQLMQATTIMANFTLAEADELRRAVGKKKAEKLVPLKTKFMAGSAANGITQHDAESVFTIFENATRYSFNKAHSLSYAQLACQTAWLKAYYTIEFMCALFSSNADGYKKEQKFELYANECGLLGIHILPPDINSSELDFTIEDNKIRFGFNGIKGLGDQFAKTLIDLRKEHGRFDDFTEFIKLLEDKELLAGNKSKLEILAQVGAFDELNPNRGRLLSQLLQSIDMAKETRRRNRTGKIALIDMHAAVKPKLGTRDLTLSRKKLLEKEHLSLVFT